MHLLEMPTITNFGDANTVGNTTLQQNLTVQGAQSTFSGNLLASSASISIGNAASRFGNLFAVTQNVTTLNTTAIYGTAGFVGVGVSTGLGATLQVQGNIYASNSISTTNVIATNVNVTTTNTLSIYGPSGFVGVGTSNPSGTSLYVLGNIYATNALSTTNVLATTTNTTTTNVLSIYGPSGFVGVGTNTPSGTSLYVVGNVFATNALTTTNIVATGSISYTEDLTKRYPYLTPDTSNSTLIQNWISATCNAAGQPVDSWWASSTAPVYGNVAAGPQGSSDYAGGVLLPDGRVLFVPQNSSNVGFYNPSTGLFSAVAATGLAATANKFRGGVLVPNGNVVFVPFGQSNVGMFNPVTYAYSNVAVGAASAGNNLRFQGGVLGPTGNVIMIPRDSANVCHFNPTTLAMTNVGPIAAQGAGLFGAGVLLPNGNVAMSPLNSMNIGMYNSYSMTTAGFTNVGPIATTGSWESAQLAPTGNIFFPPSTATNVLVYNPTVVSSPIGAGGFSNIKVTGTAGTNNFFQGTTLLPTGNIIMAATDSANIVMIDPIALSFSNCATVSGQGLQRFFGATLVPNGQVVFCPLNSANVGVLNTMVPAPPEFCISPYFNKF